MKKLKLIALLSNPDIPDVEVYLSGDAEGNEFRSVDDVTVEWEDDLDYYEIPGPALIIWPV